MNTLKSYCLVSKYPCTIKATRNLLVEIGQGIYKVSFDHLIGQKKKKKVLSKHKGAHQRDIGVKLEEFPMAKMRTIGVTIFMKILDYNLKNINIHDSILA